MKRVEVEAGFRGFYKSGEYKITVTIEENGIGVIADGRTVAGLNEGNFFRLFKPMRSLCEGKQYVEKRGEISLEELIDDGFINLRSVVV